MKTANIRFSTYIYQFHEINIFKDCDARKYGKACSESCGACLHSTICNHITGDCGLGCEPGWQKTAQCKTGNYLIVTSSITLCLSNNYCKCMNLLNNISKQKRQFMEIQLTFDTYQMKLLIQCYLNVIHFEQKNMSFKQIESQLK